MTGSGWRFSASPSPCGYRVPPGCRPLARSRNALGRSPTDEFGDAITLMATSRRNWRWPRQRPPPGPSPEWRRKSRGAGPAPAGTVISGRVDETGQRVERREKATTRKRMMCGGPAAKGYASSRKCHWATSPRSGSFHNTVLPYLSRFHASQDSGREEHGCLCDDKAEVVFNGRRRLRAPETVGLRPFDGRSDPIIGGHQTATGRDRQAR